MFAYLEKHTASRNRHYDRALSAFEMAEWMEFRPVIIAFVNAGNSFINARLLNSSRILPR